RDANSRLVAAMAGRGAAKDLNILPLSAWHSGHGRSCRRLGPVANGPEPTYGGASLRRRFQIAVMPPSTGRSTPAMKLASSETRNKAVDAISSGRPSRPNGTAAANCARAWSAPSLVGPLFGRRLLLENRRVDGPRADRIDPDATILQLRRP